jgi:Tol biopolymer transport system component
MPPRNFAPGQHAELWVLNVETGERVLRHTSSTVLFEAPNWTSDGKWLVFNGDGLLFKIAATGDGEPEQIDLGDIPPINNDHVLSPDGTAVYVSADDGHLYAVPFSGGSPRRVSNDRGPGFHYYLHGISPDGTTLAYIGLQENADGPATTNVWTIPTAGGSDVQITDDSFPDDGSEYSADGRWIYFNSERASTEPGHAQLFRIPTAGGTPEQLTADERVNWFPHETADGSKIVYISFPTGTLGHPADIEDVKLRLLTADGEIRELVTLFGGQGTMNVASWAPDSARFAYVAYSRD